MNEILFNLEAFLLPAKEIPTDFDNIPKSKFKKNIQALLPTERLDKVLLQVAIADHIR
jgi:hypothetical protein